MKTILRGRVRLAAAVSLFFLTAGGALLGCRAANPRAELESAVETMESADGAALLELIDRRDGAFDRYRQEKDRLAMRFQELNADYDTPTAELEELVTELDRAWIAFRDEAIAVALEMRDLTTEEEWRALAPLDLDSLLADSNR